MADRDIYPKWTFRCSRAHVHQFRLDMYINRPRVDFLSHVNFLSPGTDRWTASFSGPTSMLPRPPWCGHQHSNHHHFDCNHQFYQPVQVDSRLLGLDVNAWHNGCSHLRHQVGTQSKILEQKRIFFKINILIVLLSVWPTNAIQACLRTRCLFLGARVTYFKQRLLDKNLPFFRSHCKQKLVVHFKW